MNVPGESGYRVPDGLPPQAGQIAPQALETNLDRIAELAKARRDEFEVFYYSLELAEEISDAELDALVEATAAPIIAAIDCTQCANCCRTLDVYLTPEDADRLAEGLMIPVDAVIARHVDREAAARMDEWGKFRERPCAFLNGQRCTIYPHRPETCRTYPALTPDFRWTLADTLDGAAACPIIYHVLNDLIKKLDSLI